MYFSGGVEFARSLLVAHGLGVVWRVGLLTLLGGGAGLLAMLFCHRVLYRKGFLKLSLGRDRYYEWSVLGLWILAVPTLAVISGALVGTWWAGQHLIKTEHLGERLGRFGFKAIAASVASAHLETAADARAQLADELMKGTQKISVRELSVYTSHHVGQVSAGRIWSPSSRLHGPTAWCVEQTVDCIAYAQLGGEGDVVYKLVGKVSEHDRSTDNDGLVTVEEISDVACKLYGDRGVNGLWVAFVLQFLIPVALVFALILVMPPLLAWAVRQLIAWRTRRRQPG